MFRTIFISCFSIGLVYSCAYFKESPDLSLDRAQAAQAGTYLPQLRLQPASACWTSAAAWGGLVMYAAKHYGVNALGIR